MKFLVTGVSGCIGAWVVKHFIDQGHSVIGTDISEDLSRLRLIAPTAINSERFRQQYLDVRDPAKVLLLLEQENVDGVVHLAALQLPFCKADPINGAMVNIIGHLAFLEAARKLPFSYTYASSTAVYGPSIGRVIKEDENLVPASLYGVYKRTDEEVARIYAADYDVSSVCLRPWIVYGPGRDQGLTADLTIALFHAAKKLPYRIRFTGRVKVEYAEEVAAAFVRAALRPLPGAHVYTLGGPTISVPEVIRIINSTTGTNGLVTCADEDLPIACETTDAGFQRDYGPYPYFEMGVGIERTLAIWRNAGLI